MARLSLPPARAGDVLRSLAFYPIFYLGSLVLVLTGVAMMPFSSSTARRMGRRWSGYHRWCVTSLLGIDIVVEGPIPDSEVLYAIKHESFFEAIDLPTLLDSPAIFAKAELMRIPGWGSVARSYGLVEVDRAAGATALRRMLAAARGFTAEGRSLAIFPEGTRVPTGVRAPLQSGFAGLYKLLGLPVIPVAIDSGRLYHRWWKCRGTITVRFGGQIAPGLPRDEVEQQVLAAINALNHP